MPEPVAAPAPADPVVSPADTLRQALTTYLPDGFRDEDGVWHDGPVLQDALAALDALLAVGERDRAEIAGLWRQLHELQDVWEDREKTWRERDRRQIAQLTSGLERIAAHPHGGILVNIARAVLADEEDARP